jgi:hypothetical protein
MTDNALEIRRCSVCMHGYIDISRQVMAKTQRTATRADKSMFVLPGGRLQIWYRNYERNIRHLSTTSQNAINDPQSQLLQNA